MSSALAKAREQLAQRRKVLAAAKAAYVKAKANVAASVATVKRLTLRQKPGAWMAGAIRDPVPSIGKSTVGKRAGLLHTTEGTNFIAMDQVLKAKGACPHFLVGPAGQIRQYRPMWDAATALENPAGGVETNRKMVIQIEVCAFAAHPDWPEAQRQAVAKVMAFCRRHWVPLQCTVTFTDAAHVRRLSGPAWIAYNGWCGHQHAPEQPSGHWDPGAINIADLLARARKLL